MPSTFLSCKPAEFAKYSSIPPFRGFLWISTASCSASVLGVVIVGLAKEDEAGSDSVLADGLSAHPVRHAMPATRTTMAKRQRILQGTTRETLTGSAKRSPQLSLLPDNR